MKTLRNLLSLALVAGLALSFTLPAPSANAASASVSASMVTAEARSVDRPAASTGVSEAALFDIYVDTVVFYGGHEWVRRDWYTPNGVWFRYEMFLIN